MLQSCGKIYIFWNFIMSGNRNRTRIRNRSPLTSVTAYSHDMPFESQQCYIIIIQFIYIVGEPGNAPYANVLWLNISLVWCHQVKSANANPFWCHAIMEESDFTRKSPPIFPHSQPILTPRPLCSGPRLIRISHLSSCRHICTRFYPGSSQSQALPMKSNELNFNLFSKICVDLYTLRWG